MVGKIKIMLANVDVPKDKSPTEYSALERRRDILDLVYASGHPKQLSKTALAQRYGVSGAMITKDFDVIADEMKQSLGSDIYFLSRVVYEKSILELMRQRRFVEACKVVESYNKWLLDLGIEERAPGKFEFSGRITAESIIVAFDEFEAIQKRMDENEEKLLLNGIDLKVEQNGGN